MGIFLPKNEQHKQQMAQEAERNKYRNWMEGLSDELIKWTINKDLSIGDFETLISLTKQRFELTYGKSKIKDIKNEHQAN
jgi:UPF0288 family protein (methanogenesis marker protein 3)